MWTLEKLREVVADRGENASEASSVGQLLLAHERLKGRTEEDYPRDKAAKELDLLLETAAGPLPRPQAREYPGLKQLRAYAVDRGLLRAAEKTKAAERQQGEPAISPPRGVAAVVRDYARAKDSERDRG